MIGLSELKETYEEVLVIANKALADPTLPFPLRGTYEKMRDDATWLLAHYREDND